MSRVRRCLSHALRGAGLLAAWPVLAADPAGSLLDQLAPVAAPPRVEVASWVEAGEAASELVVTLHPRNGAKLVADPGVVVTPVARAGIAWIGADPLHHALPGHDYFAPPLTLRVPFVGGDGRPVEAGIEYAYCIVERQCLFGEAKVSAATQPPG